MPTQTHTPETSRDGDASPFLIRLRLLELAKDIIIGNDYGKETTPEEVVDVAVKLNAFVSDGGRR
jgi:hypothetical protein